MIADDDALRAAARLRERLPLVAVHRFDDGRDEPEPDVGPLTREERLMRNAAAVRVWRARQLDEARARGLSFEKYRAMVRAQQEGDATSG